VPEFVEEDDEEISSEGRAEDKADATLLDDSDIKE
jgi:pyruvate dehydrogenase E1 component